MFSLGMSLENDLVRGKGRIEVILGPMFSGKTTELMRRIRRYKMANFKCIVIKYEGDRRYSVSEVATHDMSTLPAISAKALLKLQDTILDYDVIGIDEGQFFPDITEFCESSANLGKILIIAALDGTYQRTPFGDVLNLVPLAESIIKLNAICMVCFSNASFTKRTSNEKAVEIIGGSDKYMAVCRECFHLTGPIKNSIKRNEKKQKAVLAPIIQNS